VIMTYYGVNYYLSGLHSYGAGSAPGVPWQLFAYAGIEGAFLLWALARLKGKVPVRAGKKLSSPANQISGLRSKTTEVPS
jgi:hypothetical protein